MELPRVFRELSLLSLALRRWPSYPNGRRRRHCRQAKSPNQGMPGRSDQDIDRVGMAGEGRCTELINVPKLTRLRQNEIAQQMQRQQHASAAIGTELRFQVLAGVHFPDPRRQIGRNARRANRELERSTRLERAKPMPNGVLA